jgi:hypothetical protein
MKFLIILYMISHVISKCIFNVLTCLVTILSVSIAHCKEMNALCRAHIRCQSVAILIHFMRIHRLVPA